MAGFEYDIFSIAWGHGGGKAETKIRNELNARGANGWELVGMTRDESPDDDHSEEVVLFVFKRPAKKGKKKDKKDKKAKKDKKPKSEKAPETQKVPNVQKPPPPEKPRKKRKK
jgi:hypothetical protein